MTLLLPLLTLRSLRARWFTVPSPQNSQRQKDDALPLKLVKVKFDALVATQKWDAAAALICSLRRPDPTDEDDCDVANAFVEPLIDAMLKAGAVDALVDISLGQYESEVAAKLKRESNRADPSPDSRGHFKLRFAFHSARRDFATGASGLGE